MKDRAANNPQSVADLPFVVTCAPEPKAPPLRWAYSKKPWQRKHWRWYFVKDPCMGALKYGMYHALRFIPVAWPSAVGACIAPFSQKLYRDMDFAQRISANMAVLNPASSETERQKAINSWWQNSGRIYAEFSAVEKLAAQQAQSKTLKTGITDATKAYENILFVSVHVGSWEVLFATLDLCLKPAVIGPYQPEASRFSNRIIEASRRRRNQFAFPPGQKSATYLSRFIKNKSAIGFFMIDEVSDDQIHFPLFGRAPVQSTNAARAVKIAMRSNALIVPIIMPRRSGTQFDVQILDPVEIRHSADDKDAVAETIQQLNQTLEPYVRAHLDQWYMLANLRLDE